jgi:hypothetical protein
MLNRFRRTNNEDIPHEIKRMSNEAILPERLWPNQVEMRNYFKKVTITAKDNPLPSGKIRLLRQIPTEIDEKQIFNPQTIELKAEDVKYLDGKLYNSTHKLCQLYAAKNIRAAENFSALEYRNRKNNAKMNRENPACMKTGVPYSFEINVNGKIVTKTPTVIKAIKAKQGNLIYSHVPAKHANRDCACAQPFKNNNMPSLLFSNICKPASLTLQYDEDEDLPSITSIQGIKKQHESFSNVYYASVSAEGLVSPHLAMRSSVNTMILLKFGAI